MRYEHKELIHDYLKIENRNKRIEERMYNAQLVFDAKNRIGGTDFYDPIGVRNKKFRLESEVCSFVDYIETCERNIEKNNRRQYYFKAYTDTLDPHTYSSLIRRYGNISHFDDIQELGHDEQVLDEILEIEEAISHEFNSLLYVGENKDESLNERNPIRNQRQEKTFGAIAGLIGV